MKQESITEKIVARIGNGDGRCWSSSDFAEFGSRLAISQALSRLEKCGALISPLRGYYCVPRRSKLLDELLPPDYKELACAIARHYGWQVLPCGDVLLNELGLSTQVPVKYSFVSTGPYRYYDVVGTRIEFKHSANREMFNMSAEVATVVQAIKTLGANGLTDICCSRLMEVVLRIGAEKVVREAKGTTSWIYEMILKLVKGEQL